MNRNATTPVFVLIEFPEFVRNQEYLNPRRSRLQMFFKAGVLNFTGKHFNKKHIVDLKQIFQRKHSLKIL